MKMTLYCAKVTGDPKNCYYPTPVVVTDEASMKQAAALDHVSALYRDNYRRNENFIQADCVVMDCDNDHSDDPAEWATPSDVAKTFLNVQMMVVYSRNHMRQKGGKSPRPRFHCYFPCRILANAQQCSVLKKEVLRRFPLFDSNALDNARFFFGVTDPKIEIMDGATTIEDHLIRIIKAEQKVATDRSVGIIPEGHRNTTMHRYACRLVKQYGNSDKAHQRFLKESERCQPPLDDEELDRIWQNAVKFGEKIANESSYIPPDAYNSEYVLMPHDFSDVGQATVLAREYGNQLRYSPATDFLVYNGSIWEESRPKAQSLAQELTFRQLGEAERAIEGMKQALVKQGFTALAEGVSSRRLGVDLNESQKSLIKGYDFAQNYKKSAIRRRESKCITATLKETQPMVLIDPANLDSVPFLLNLPSGTCDLRTGKVRAHDPADYLTRQTDIDPSQEGMDIWLDALETFFQNDQALIDYVQEIVGLAAIGKVYVEALIIAYGEGRNGKSTFWNTIARVLGTYSGNMSADTLTVGCKRNVKPEMAEARGKRLIIAAELEDSTRLNTSKVKQLCSTDQVFAEKKFKSPFAFTPTHTLVLYTNHLPKVGATDAGIWRRLIVIPFNARIQGSSDVKNYADYLFVNAGGAVLSWIIEGAQRVIAKDFHLVQPEVVRNAIGAYRDENDWLSHFIEDRCETAADFEEQSGELYNEYRCYCKRMGEHTRSTADFYAELENAGFQRRKTRSGKIVQGLRLIQEFDLTE